MPILANGGSDPWEWVKLLLMIFVPILTAMIGAIITIWVRVEKQLSKHALEIQDHQESSEGSMEEWRLDRTTLWAAHEKQRDKVDHLSNASAKHDAEIIALARELEVLRRQSGGSHRGRTI